MRKGSHMSQIPHRRYFETPLASLSRSKTSVGSIEPSPSLVITQTMMNKPLPILYHPRRGVITNHKHDIQPVRRGVIDHAQRGVQGSLRPSERQSNPLQGAINRPLRNCLTAPLRPVEQRASLPAGTPAPNLPAPPR